MPLTTDDDKRQGSKRHGVSPAGSKRYGVSPPVGTRLTVEGHGGGTVKGHGCCGRGRNRVHIEYDDGTDYHCAIDDIEDDEDNDRGETHHFVLSQEADSRIAGEGDTDEESEDFLLDPTEARKYRAVAARLN